MLTAWLPLLGPLFLAGYQQQALAQAIRHQEGVPAFRLDLATMRLGLISHILVALSGIVAGLLTLPLWSLGHEPTSVDLTATALVQAFAGPTHLTVTVLSATLASLCLVRYAASGSARAAMDPVMLWNFLRAEPSLWIATAVTGFVIVELPLTVVWLAPLTQGQEIVIWLTVQALVQPVVTLVQAQLFAQAYQTTKQTLAIRRARVVRVRW
jgi:hypothetical protein